MTKRILFNLAQAIIFVLVDSSLALAQKSLGDRDVAIHVTSQGLKKVAQDILSQFVGSDGKIIRKTLPEIVPAVKKDALVITAKNVSTDKLPSPLSIYLKKVLHLFGENKINLFFNIIDPVYSGKFNLLDFSISNINSIQKTMEVNLTLEIKQLQANTPAIYIAAKGVLPPQNFQELDIRNSSSCQNLNNKNMSSFIEASIGGGIRVSQGNVPVILKAKATINLANNELIHFETIANNFDSTNGANLSISLFDPMNIKIPDFYVYYENQDTHVVECEKMDLSPIKEFITSQTVLRPLSHAITKAIGEVLKKEVAKKINEQLAKLNIQVPLAFGGQLQIPEISPEDQLALKLVEDSEINDFLETISYSVRPGTMVKENEAGIALSADFSVNINDGIAHNELSSATRKFLAPASDFKFSNFQDLSADFSVAIAPTAVNKILGTALKLTIDFLSPLGFSLPKGNEISFAPVDNETLALVPLIRFNFNQIQGHPFLRNQLYITYKDKEFAPYNFLVRTLGKTVFGMEVIQDLAATKVGSEIEKFQKNFFSHQSLEEVKEMMSWFYHSEGQLEFPLQFLVSPTIVKEKPLDKYTEEEIENVDLCQTQVVADYVSCPQKETFIKISISPPSENSIYQNVLNIPQQIDGSSPTLRKAVKFGLSKIFASLKTFELYIPFSKISTLTGLTPSKIIVGPTGHLIFQTQLQNLPFNIVDSMKEKREKEKQQREEGQ